MTSNFVCLCPYSSVDKIKNENKSIKFAMKLGFKWTFKI